MDVVLVISHYLGMFSLDEEMNDLLRDIWELFPIILGCSH